ncbi:MAG: Mov34/MPN/PAD-1 family protein [Phycisphaerae bacterium]|nr:Mov34/MPN/PAD-1 family protein [Phycisphaerae bacterium]
MTSSPNEFWSKDGRFGLRFSSDVLEQIRIVCCKAGGLETGGILVGRYTEDRRCAEVTRISGLPADSRAGRRWLIRGVKGLLSWLQDLWVRDREYYLGEWHFHPSGDLASSDTDRSSMRTVMKSQRCQCPEPVLVIVCPLEPNGLDIEAYVHRLEDAPVRLSPSPYKAIAPIAVVPLATYRWTWYGC